jgi:NhaA family Na+:H+ antiporter
LPTGGSPWRHSWLSSDRAVPRLIARPLRTFLSTETAGGLVLLAATLLALVWANSPLNESYNALWETELSFRFGDFRVSEDLRHWVNDALMVLFFFVVGLEIKRELVVGELNDARKAALPALAALGGMVVPALFYLAFNAGGPASDGWGIPMATDIAFAVGALALMGNRVPSGLKVFVLSLAVVDDIGAIIVIALFYSSGLEFDWLFVAFSLLVMMLALNRLRVLWVPAYVVLGAGVWFATLESGVHATIAGVALGLLTPARPSDPRGVSDVLDKSAALSLETDAQNVRAVTLEAQEVVSVAERLEHLLHPYTSYIIIPLFALANAGVLLDGEAFRAALSSEVTLGIVSGLVLGKIIGISAMSWLAVRLKLGRLPEGVGKRHLVGGAAVAGIGFTVSLFITALAFDDPSLIDSAKTGVFTASIIAGLVGAAVLFAAPKVTEDD